MAAVILSGHSHTCQVLWCAPETDARVPALPAAAPAASAAEGGSACQCLPASICAYMATSEGAGTRRCCCSLHRSACAARMHVTICLFIALDYMCIMGMSLNCLHRVSCSYNCQQLTELGFQNNQHHILSIVGFHVGAEHAFQT